jgi:hypothetical protein
VAQVICTLPNASKVINGVKFSEHKMGVISEEVSDETAANFAKIKGYRIVPPGKTPGASELSKTEAKADDKAKTETPKPAEPVKPEEASK